MNKEIFEHSFNKISDEEQHLLRSCFKNYDYQGATYTYLANHIWCKDYNLRWEQIGNYICMAWVFEDEDGMHAHFSMPLTVSGNYDISELRDCIIEVKRRFDDVKIPFAVRMVPGHMREILEEAFPGDITWEHQEDLDEYVYSKDKLINLSGRALHKKKNHLNYFLNNYKYEVKELTYEMYEDIMRLSDIVRKERERNQEELASLAMEKKAIGEILKHLYEKDVYAVGIFIDGKMEACAIGELVNCENAIEHFEKANVEIRGLYQAICSEFCKALPDSVLYVNREEDMGIENLRHAKQALRPVMMAEKYIAYIK